MANTNSETEKRLWDAADQLRANSKLRSSEYSTPVLGLIFLRYADHKFELAEKELAGRGTGRRTIGRTDYQARGVMYLPPQARFSRLMELPEGADIGKAINDAMRAIEEENEELGVLNTHPGSWRRGSRQMWLSCWREQHDLRNHPADSMETVSFWGIEHPQSVWCTIQ